MEKQERQFKGIWIPATIWLNSNMTAVDKILLADIDSFTGNKKTFYKSNETIASELFVSVKSVSRSVKKLKELGFITVSGNKRQRLIVAKGHYVQSERQKVHDSSQIVPSEGSKCPTTNTVTNTITNSTTKGVTELPFTSDKFLEAWLLWNSERKKKYTDKGARMALKRLVKLSDNNEGEAIEIIEYCLAQNYQGLFKEKNNDKRNNKKFDTDVYSNLLDTLEHKPS